MIRARIAQDWNMFGIAVQVFMTEGDSERPSMVMHIEGDGTTVGRPRWDVLPQDPVAVEPTFRIGDEEARALLDALTRHYQGASDMHTVRADLLHERGRVDKLIGTMAELASRPQTIQLRKAEQ